MKQSKRKHQIQATYKNIHNLQKNAELEELHIRKLLEIRRDKSIAKFKEKFGFNIKIKQIEKLE